MKKLIFSLIIVLSLAFTSHAGFIGEMGKDNPVTTPSLVDEFISGTYTTGGIGDLGWLLSVGTITNPGTILNRPGLRRLDTGATINTIVAIGLMSEATILSYDADNYFDITFIVRPQANTLEEIRVGMLGSVTAAPPANGYYFLFDTSGSNESTNTTKWVCVTRSASTDTDTASSITVNANNWYNLRIAGNSTSATFYINNVPECTHTTNMYTANASPIIQIENLTAASKTIDIDFFSLRGSGLSR